MDAPIRNTPSLIAKIERLRDELVKRYEALVRQAGVEKTDRNITAVAQYQIQVETAALIRAAEDVQVLIRQLQEMWLFGQLNTIGESKVQQQSDENAKTVAGLLKQLANRQEEPAPESNTNGINGRAEK